MYTEWFWDSMVNAYVQWWCVLNDVTNEPIRKFPTGAVRQIV